MKKAQSAVEFVVLSTVMLLFFAIAFIYIQRLLVDYTFSARDTQIAAVQEAIEKEVALAKTMPAGYTRTFQLPSSINGISYAVVVQNETPPLRDSILITFQQEQRAVFLTEDVSGTIIPGTNILRKSSSIVFN